MGKKKTKKILYKDFEDYWRNGKHGFSSAGREYVIEIWNDLEPTIMANREDWEQLLIHETKKSREDFIRYLRLMSEYLKEFDLEKVAGIKFHRWILDKILESKPKK